jgi:curli production assembly/transport component CsgF
MKSLNILLIASIVIPGVSTASELIYQPTNPSFGGPPLNGSFLLNSAQAQDTFKDPDALDPLESFNRDPLENFAENLNRQVLNQIARRIVDDIFEGDSLGEGGSFITDDFMINIITTNPDVLIVEITDNNTGNQTTIEIPYF